MHLKAPDLVLLALGICSPRQQGIADACALLGRACGALRLPQEVHALLPELPLADDAIPDQLIKQVAQGPTSTTDHTRLQETHVASS